MKNKSNKKFILSIIGEIIIVLYLFPAFCFMTFDLKICEKEEKVHLTKEIIVEKWIECANDVEATVYNAVPSQCNKDFGYTASMFYLDLYDVEAHKIIAMERTFMKKLDLVYGDVVKIEGVGKYDGIYQIQDTMNKRFAGQHKIDILVNENVKLGKWNNVKLYKLKDKKHTDLFKSAFKPEISKQENKMQMKQKIKEWKSK